MDADFDNDNQVLPRKRDLQWTRIIYLATADKSMEDPAVGSVIGVHPHPLALVRIANK